MIYELLDDFVTWSDGQRQFAPRTTRNNFQAVVRMCVFLKIKLEDNDLDDITLSRPQDIDD